MTKPHEVTVTRQQELEYASMLGFPAEDAPVVAEIIKKIIQRVRAEERERCARVAATAPIETYASPPYIAQAKQVRLTVAAAIRALGDE